MIKAKLKSLKTSKNEPKLKNLIRLVRGIGWAIFITLLGMPLILGIENIFNYEAVPGAITILGFLIFYLILTIQNDSKYNSYLECFFWDRKIRYAFALLLIVSVFINDPFFSNEETKEDQISQLITQLERANQGLDTLKVKLNKINRNLDEYQNLSLLVNNHLNLNDVDKLEDSLRFNYNEVKSILVQINNYKGLITYPFEKTFQMVNNSKDIQSRIDILNTSIKQFEEKLTITEDNLDKFNHHISALRELVKIKSTLDDLRDEKTKLKQNIRSLEKEGEILLEKSIKSSNFDNDSEKIINLIKSQIILRAKTEIEKRRKGEFLDKADWKTRPSFPENNQHIHDYWKRIQKERDVLYSQTQSISFNNLDQLVKRTAERKDIWLNHFVSRYPVGRYNTDYVLNRVSFEENRALLTEYTQYKNFSWCLIIT